MNVKHGENEIPVQEKNFCTNGKTALLITVNNFKFITLISQKL